LFDEVGCLRDQRLIGLDEIPCRFTSRNTLVSSVDTSVNDFPGRFSSVDTSVNDFPGRSSSVDTSKTLFPDRFSSVDTSKTLFPDRFSSVDALVDRRRFSRPSFLARSTRSTGPG
jgi:hypothetical protein